MSTKFYKVKKGDTLISISQKFFGINKVNEIAKLNGIQNKNKISVNQILKLPIDGQLNIQKERIIYTIKPGDNLINISKYFFDSPNYVKIIADINGIRNVNSIFIGQQIEIPDSDQANNINTTTKVKTVEVNGKIESIYLRTPNGLNEIIDTFGDIYKYITKSGTISSKWGETHLEYLELPFPLPIAWDTSQTATRIRCNKKLVKIFKNIFDEIVENNLKKEITSYGGTYNFRKKTRNSALSTHSWGIAIDINPLTNAFGTKGNMHPKIIEIFRDHGFKWGGDWNGRGCDPMHFQYCIGY